MDKKTLWEKRFAQDTPRIERYDGWLDKYQSILTNGGAPILDLGSGAGQDTRHVKSLGLDVIDLDFSTTALSHVSSNINSVCVLGDIACLPFKPSRFNVIVADLSLHYFHQSDMPGILFGIAECMCQHAHLLVRVNSVKDELFGATGRSEEIIDGELKVFYDMNTFSEVFGCFHIETIVEKTTDCYGRLKRVIEGVLKKP